MLGNWSAATLLLIPLVAGLAVVLALILGADADPGRAHRQGGVSRALEARDRSRGAEQTDRREHS